MEPVPCKCAKQQKDDHDLLVAHIAAFNEYRRSMDDRLAKLNELREQVMKDRETYLRTDVYNVQQEGVARRVEVVSETLTDRLNQWSQRLGEIERWQAKVIGVGIAMAALTATIGGLIGHFWK